MRGLKLDSGTDLIQLTGGARDRAAQLRMRPQVTA